MTDDWWIERTGKELDKSMKNYRGEYSLIDRPAQSGLYTRSPYSFDIEEIKREIQIFCEENADDFAEYQKKQERMINYLVGQVMKESKGQANPKKVKEMLRERLNEMAKIKLEQQITDFIKELKDETDGIYGVPPFPHIQETDDE